MMVSLRLGKPMRAPPHLSWGFPVLPLKQFHHLSSCWPTHLGMIFSHRFPLKLGCCFSKCMRTMGERLTNQVSWHAPVPLLLGQGSAPSSLKAGMTGRALPEELRASSFPTLYWDSVVNPVRLPLSALGYCLHTLVSEWKVCLGTVVWLLSWFF